MRIKLVEVRLLTLEFEGPAFWQLAHPSLPNNPTHLSHPVIVSGSTAETCAAEVNLYCPRGKRGDRLWVRETFAALSAGECEPIKPAQAYG